MNFCSPFIIDGQAYNTGQFIFLTCIVASTLTLATIQEKVIDRINQIKRRQRTEKVPPDEDEVRIKLKNTLTTAGNALGFLAILIWMQLVITVLLVFRIAFYFIYCWVPILFDFAIIGLSVISFGLWPIYFGVFGRGDKICFLVKKKNE